MHQTRRSVNPESKNESKPTRIIAIVFFLFAAAWGWQLADYFTRAPVVEDAHAGMHADDERALENP